MTSEHPALDAAALEARLGDLVARLEVRARAGSTNAELGAAVRAEPEAWPDFSVLVADHQESGRGRAGRDWQTPAGTSLTVSFLLRPGVPPSSFGWASLLGALAAVRAVGAFGLVARAKWPNDVVVGVRGAAHVDGWGANRKVAGVLGEVAGDAVVLGIGINVAQTPEELPVPWAASLATLDATLGEHPREDLLVMLAHQLWLLDEQWRAADGDAAAAGIAEEYAAASATLGQAVVVELPGGRVLAGVADGFAADGALLVRRADGQVEAVRSGDVHHVRLPDV